MLVLTRRTGEEIVIDGNIRVKVLLVHGDRVRLGIIAPESVRVDRQEVHERRSEFSAETAVTLQRVARSLGNKRPLQRKLAAVASALCTSCDKLPLGQQSVT